MTEKLREPREIFLVGTISKNGKIEGGPCAGIEHAERPWLVPQWIENREEQVTMPERIICLDGLPSQRSGDLGAIDLRYILNYPIPITVPYTRPTIIWVCRRNASSHKISGCGLASECVFECLHTPRPIKNPGPDSRETDSAATRTGPARGGTSNQLTAKRSPGDNAPPSPLVKILGSGGL